MRFSFSRLAALPAADRRLLAEAVATLASASAAIAYRPFREVVGGAARPLNRRSAEADREVPDRCVWAIKAAARHVPWRVVCFQQGLALHRMLRRRGVPCRLHYGVRQDAERGVTAHVWVTLNGAAILGGEAAEGFSCLATYPFEETSVAGVTPAGALLKEKRS